jgi:hypothetical protein
MSLSRTSLEASSRENNTNPEGKMVRKMQARV